MPAQVKMPPTDYDLILLQGGLDQLTPNFRLKPGFVRDASNFECSTYGGYARVAGYERYDGRSRPSDATYTVVQVSVFTNTPTVGQTLTGATSGATGQIIAVGANYIALTLLSGTFLSTEIYKVGSTVIGPGYGLAYDTSGNGNYGTYQSGVTIGKPGAVTGDPDTQAYFDGTNNGYILVPCPAALQTKLAVTIEAIITPTAATVSYGIIARAGTASDLQWCLMFLWSGPGNPASLTYHWTPDGVNFFFVSSPTFAVPAGWSSHVAMVRASDGVSISFYLGGLLLGTATAASQAQTLVGATNICIGGFSAQQFVGYIDEPAAYAAALSPARISAHANAMYGPNTNLLPYSVPDNTNWIWNGATKGTPNYGIAPDGTVSTYRTINTIQPVEGGSPAYIVGSIIPGKPYTYSLYVKSVDPTKPIQLYVDGAWNAGLTYGSAQAIFMTPNTPPILEGFATAASLQDVSALYGAGWYRASLTFNAPFGSTAACHVNPYEPNPSSQEWWGAQLEPGTVATRYLPTLGSALTITGYPQTLLADSPTMYLRLGESGASINVSSQLNAQYLNLAADVYRALIGAVPGSGPIRGVVSAVISGVRYVYAFRDNVGGTATLPYQASAGGWVAVTLYNEVAFTVGGTSQPAEGSTLTQGANTATIKRVVWESGSWSGNTAAGRLIVTTPAPGNFAAGAATIGGINVTLSGAQTAISFSPGGKFEFDITNFAGQLATRRIYGCDGVNRAFEFDGTILVPISTGAATDSPKHLRAHQKALVLAIGSSLMISGPGTPYKFNSTDGGAEIATGDTITNLVIQPGNQTAPALCVTCRNISNMLYGKSAADWDLVAFTSATGAIDYMMQNLDSSYLLDDRGIVNFQTALQFGNFVQATLTQNIHNLIVDKRSISSCSCVCKDKSQFRTFFTDGSALYSTFLNGKLVGHMPMQFADTVNVVWSWENASGDEEIYFGANTGGYVFQMERGSSFDGQNIDARLMLSWNAIKTPRIIKTYRKASLEIQGNFYAEVAFSYSLSYGSTKVGQPTPQTYASGFTGTPKWDNVNWDAFIWDGQTLSPTEVEMRGDGENVQVIITSTTDYIYPFVIDSIITHYTPRRGLR